MKYWKKSRNYRKRTDANGKVQHIIIIDGSDIEVNVEVYKAYSQADRRERYGYEREKGRMLSLERMDDDNMKLEFFTKHRSESPEDAVIKAMLLSEALGALSKLTMDERDLIKAVVMDGVPEKEYALRFGISQVAVHKRKHRLLKKIGRLMGY